MKFCFSVCRFDAADITSIREVAADTTTKTFLQINAD
jgi:hypothetical protein